MSGGLYAVTVLIEGHDILGRPVAPEGVLEVRKYAALSEDHARESAALCLTDNEEIVDVAAASPQPHKAAEGTEQ